MRELLSDANFVNLAVTQTIRHSQREQYGVHPWTQAVRSYADIRSKLEKLRKKYQVHYQIVIELHDNLDVHYHMLACMKNTNRKWFEIAYKALFDEVGNYKIKGVGSLDGWLDYMAKVDKKDVTYYLPLTSKYLLDHFGLQDTDDKLEFRFKAYQHWLKQDQDEVIEGGSALKYYFNARGLNNEYALKMGEE